MQLPSLDMKTSWKRSYHIFKADRIIRVVWHCWMTSYAPLRSIPYCAWSYPPWSEGGTLLTLGRWYCGLDWLDALPNNISHGPTWGHVFQPAFRLGDAHEPRWAIYLMLQAELHWPGSFDGSGSDFNLAATWPVMASPSQLTYSGWCCCSTLLDWYFTLWYALFFIAITIFGG